MYKVFLRTFGCQMNVHDSELIKVDLLRAGYEFTEKASEADIILFNTCAVREHAEDRVQSHIGALRKYLENKPKLVVGLMGCIAQHLGKMWAGKYHYLKLIIGTHQLHRVPAIIEEHFATGKRIIETDEDYDVKFSRNFECEGSNFAASIAVMRGCDHNCSYCIVPRVRGKEIHRNFDDIIEEAKKLVDAGFSQITLLGQNVDSYGRKLKP
ncbi:MAG: radical SAM protein, partial [Planctomycetes bacterium]|nr:radical SAM protein [Planctomycetota bacterium]